MSDQTYFRQRAVLKHGAAIIDDITGQKRGGMRVCAACKLTKWRTGMGVCPCVATEVEFNYSF